MAKAVISKDNLSLTLSIADRKFAESKATIKAIGAGVNWLSEMNADDVSLSIDIMQKLVERRKERQEYRKNNPSESWIGSSDHIAKQKVLLADNRCGFTVEQISALETNGLLGTQAVHNQIGSMLSSETSAEERAKVKASLVEQAQ